MNVYLSRLIINWLGTVCLAVLSLFGTNIKENVVKLENATIDNTVSVESIVTEYETIKKYNSKLPSGEVRVIIEGVDGVSYIDSNGTVQQIRPVVNKVVEVGTGPQSSYVGNTTGYGADCVGCSGVVSCKTREGNYHHLVNDGMYYNDAEYGQVRILAADHRVFRCGTIIEVDNGVEETFIGIVLDTGIDMRKNWELHQLIHLDIAFITEEDPRVPYMTVNNRKAKFEVKRWGW